MKVLKEEKFPADLLLLDSSNEDGVVFVDTADLDGETTLKDKMQPKISNMMRTMNKLLYSVFVFQFLIILSLSSLSYRWMLINNESHDYLGLETSTSPVDWVV